jgi:hypothetical protein
VKPLVLLGVLLGALVLPLPACAELGINLYGLSYHFDRGRARELRLDNEINPGVGLRYRVPQSERLAWIFDVGGYRDSGRNTALLAGAGGLFKVSDGWRLGAALAVLDSATYNRGKTTLAPVPLAAYETRRVTFNFVYLPRVSDINDVATLGFWATWWVR